jgi:hypothetical protein
MADHEGGMHSGVASCIVRARLLRSTAASTAYIGSNCRGASVEGHTLCTGVCAGVDLCEHLLQKESERKK